MKINYLPPCYTYRRQGLHVSKGHFFQRRMRENSIMTRKFTYRNIEGYLVVTQEILNFKEQTTENKNKAIIDLYLSQMLNAAMWQAHSLQFSERIRLAWLCLHKYKGDFYKLNP